MNCAEHSLGYIFLSNDDEWGYICKEKDKEKVISFYEKSGRFPRLNAEREDRGMEYGWAVRK